MHIPFFFFLYFHTIGWAFPKAEAERECPSTSLQLLHLACEESTEKHQFKMLRWVRIKDVKREKDRGRQLEEREREIERWRKQKERQKEMKGRDIVRKRETDRDSETGSCAQMNLFQHRLCAVYKIWTNYVIINWAHFDFCILGCILLAALHGLRLRVCVSRGSASRMPQPFREQLSTRTVEYQWVGLKRHGSSWRRLSFSRTPSPGLHGLIFKATS